MSFLKATILFLTTITTISILYYALMPMTIYMFDATYASTPSAVGKATITTLRSYLDYYPLIFDVIAIVWWVLYTQRVEPQYSEV
jgi:hypothetical protein